MGLEGWSAQALVLAGQVEQKGLERGVAAVEGQSEDTIGT